MGMIRSMEGIVRLKITGSDLPKSLQKLAGVGIPIYEVTQTEMFTLNVTLERRHYTKANKVLSAQGDSVEILGNKGFYWTFHNLMHRPILLAGVILLTFLTLFLPTRVLFVQVEGNQLVPSNLILEAASQSGIYVGASRVEVRSEKVKNRLLQTVPQLQWAGVNTRGCVAIISVRERMQTSQTESPPMVQHIVAARDGIILSCTATAGNLICRPGEAAKKGQILISGYTDCGLVIRAEAACGRIYAQTIYDITAITPSEYAWIQEEEVESQNFTLLLGKKRINLWKDSGNEEGSCGRMYKEYYISLPGGYQLPIGIAVQTNFQQSVQTGPIPQSYGENLLTQSTGNYLLDHMIDGALISASIQCGLSDSLYCLQGRYICTEMIGKEQVEQIGEWNE